MINLIKLKDFPVLLTKEMPLIYMDMCSALSNELITLPCSFETP